MPARRPQGTEAWRLAFDDEQIDVSELCLVEVKRTRPKSSLVVRFEAADIERLRARAERDRVGVTQLVRQWTLERLDEPDHAGEELDGLIEALEQSMKVARALQRTRKRRAG